YVPGSTSTRSPSMAATMACWTVGWSAGTWMSVARAAGATTRADNARVERGAVDAMVRPPLLGCVETMTAGRHQNGHLAATLAPRVLREVPARGFRSRARVIVIPCKTLPYLVCVAG